ncbi:MAG: PadR family transcriptional regulator [Vicinamibacterales bacterium]
MSPRDDRTDVLQGTLALMVLKTLDTLGPLHGYGIARRLEQVSGDAIRLNQGTIYPALVRLEQQGWIRAKWGASEHNRRAKFYALTAAGRRQLDAETERWSRVSDVVGRILDPGDAS